MKDTINFLFEVGMLKKTPRTGYRFLGSGHESVADHSFRMAVIGYILAGQVREADVGKTVLMCLFHDLHEARTGDQNYVNKRYNHIDEKAAVNDLTGNAPFKDEVVNLIDEFNKGESIEARLAKDADQIDLIMELKQQKDLGNRYAVEWLHYARKRIITEDAKNLVKEILETDSTDWWFEKRTELWVNGPKTLQTEK